MTKKESVWDLIKQVRWFEMALGLFCMWVTLQNVQSCVQAIIP